MFVHVGGIGEDIASHSFFIPTCNSKLLFFYEFMKDCRHRIELSFGKQEAYFIVYKILEIHYTCMFNTSKNKKSLHPKTV